jgi:hypothetical protein
MSRWAASRTGSSPAPTERIDAECENDSQPT